MATPAQITANRLNAQKSTGARTPEGKARTRTNAVRHGLCSTIALMADETEKSQEFQLLLEDLRLEHQPDGPTEDILVFKMAQSFFSATRAQALLTKELDLNQAEDNSKQVGLMLRYHTTNDRAFHKSLYDLRKLQKERHKEEIGSVSQKPQEQPPTPPSTPGKKRKTPIVADPSPILDPKAVESNVPWTQNAA